MFFLILRTLRQHRWFALLGAALLLSSVGNGLTYVIVFGKLLASQATPSALTLAYILALAPGIPGSFIAEKLLTKVSPIPVLIISEMVGLTGLALPAWSLFSDSPVLLLSSQVVASFAGGMMVPVLSQLFKSGLKTADLPAASGLETFIFAANVIFGIGIGTFLYGRIPIAAILALDALSFVAGIVLLYAAHQAYRPVCTLQSDEVSITDKRWLAMLLIVTAHIYTNIVYVLATLNIMRTFPVALTGRAMAKSWRLQLIITLVLPLAAGFAADIFDPAWVLYISSGGGFVVMICLLTLNHFLGEDEVELLNIKKGN